MRLVGNDLQAVPPAALVALADEPRKAVHRVMIDLVELPGGVSVSEVARPAAQEAVDVLHDVFNRYEQPAPVRDLTDAVAGALDGLPRGAAGEEAQVPRAGSVAALAADGRIPLDVATPTRFGGCDARQATEAGRGSR